MFPLVRKKDAFTRYRGGFGVDRMHLGNRPRKSSIRHKKDRYNRPSHPQEKFLSREYGYINLYCFKLVFLTPSRWSSKSPRCPCPRRPFISFSSSRTPPTPPTPLTPFEHHHDRPMGALTSASCFTSSA